VDGKKKKSLNTHVRSGDKTSGDVGGSSGHHKRKTIGGGKGAPKEGAEDSHRPNREGRGSSSVGQMFRGRGGQWNGPKTPYRKGAIPPKVSEINGVFHLT